MQSKTVFFLFFHNLFPVRESRNKKGIFFSTAMEIRHPCGNAQRNRDMNERLKSTRKGNDLLYNDGKFGPHARGHGMSVNLRRFE